MKFDVQRKSLIRGLATAQITASQEMYMPILRAVQITGTEKGHVAVMSTDRYQLSATRLVLANEDRAAEKRKAGHELLAGQVGPAISLEWVKLALQFLRIPKALESDVVTVDVDAERVKLSTPFGAVELPRLSSEGTNPYPQIEKLLTFKPWAEGVAMQPTFMLSPRFVDSIAKIGRLAGRHENIIFRTPQKTGESLHYHVVTDADEPVVITHGLVAPITRMGANGPTDMPGGMI